MSGQTVFLFCTGIDEVLTGSSRVAGIQVQMSFWARTFARNGWIARSFSNHDTVHEVDGINFVKKIDSKWLSCLHLDVVKELLDCWRCVKSHPDLVVIRGASRCLYFLARWCQRKTIPLVLFGASDTDFELGKEIVGGGSLNRKLYQKSLKYVDLFVTQNTLQHDSLKYNYNKESLIVPNIWIPFESNESIKRYDAVWIANLRPLKRAEWFVRLAKNLPQYQFAIVGGNNNINYYEVIKQMAADTDNLVFLGAQSFDEVNKILNESRLLVCTSEFEGFPNTFLQAWAQSVPVVTTVNPSGIVTEYGLGIVVKNEQELYNVVQQILSSEALYKQSQQNIENYFSSHHNANTSYQKVMNMIKPRR